MSVWDDQWEDYEMDKNDFEAWLDSLEGEGTDEEKYDREMDRQANEEAELMSQAEYPEWMVKGQHYIMTVSNN
jgi:competence protein ComGC